MHFSLVATVGFYQTQQRAAEGLGTGFGQLTSISVEMVLCVEPVVIQQTFWISKISLVFISLLSTSCFSLT
jgi:hypothetical protein